MAAQPRGMRGSCRSLRHIFLERDSSKNSVSSKDEGREPPEERDEGSGDRSAILTVVFGSAASVGRDPPSDDRMTALLVY